MVFQLTLSIATTGLCSRLGDLIEAAKIRISEERQRGRLSDTGYAQLLTAIKQTNGQAYWQWQQQQIESRPAPQSGVEAFLYAEALAANGFYQQAIQRITQSINYRSEAFLTLRHCPAIDALREQAAYLELLADNGLSVFQVF